MAFGYKTNDITSNTKKKEKKRKNNIKASEIHGRAQILQKNFSPFLKENSSGNR